MDPELPYAGGLIPGTLEKHISGGFYIIQAPVPLHGGKHFCFLMGRNTIYIHFSGLLQNDAWPELFRGRRIFMFLNDLHEVIFLFSKLTCSCISSRQSGCGNYFGSHPSMPQAPTPTVDVLLRSPGESPGESPGHSQSWEISSDDPPRWGVEPKGGQLLRKNWVSFTLQSSSLTMFILLISRAGRRETCTEIQAGKRDKHHR